mgnify:CR=1 FL=1
MHLELPFHLLRRHRLLPVDVAVTATTTTTTTNAAAKSAAFAVFVEAEISRLHPRLLRLPLRQSQSPPSRSHQPRDRMVNPQLACP